MSQSPLFRLRPLRSGEVLDEAVLIVREHFWMFLKVILWTLFPVSLVFALLMVPMQERLISDETIPTDEAIEFLGWMLLSFVLNICLVRQLTRGILFQLAHQSFLGRRLSVRKGLLRALRRLPAAFVVSIISSGLFYSYLMTMTGVAFFEPTYAVVAIPISFLLLFGAGILHYFCYVAHAVVQIESSGPVSACLRSFHLMTKQFLVSILTICTVWLIKYVLSILTSLATNLYAQSVLEACLFSGFVMFEVAVELALYRSARCLADNYDLELLAREVELFDYDELESVPIGTRTLFSATGQIPSE